MFRWEYTCLGQSMCTGLSWSVQEKVRIYRLRWEYTGLGGSKPV